MTQNDFTPLSSVKPAGRSKLLIHLIAIAGSLAPLILGGVCTIFVDSDLLKNPIALIIFLLGILITFLNFMSFKSIAVSGTAKPKLPGGVWLQIPIFLANILLFLANIVVCYLLSVVSWHSVSMIKNDLVRGTIIIIIPVSIAALGVAYLWRFWVWLRRLLGRRPTTVK